jgi:Protein-tyrosine phosphatase
MAPEDKSKSALEKWEEHLKTEADPVIPVVEHDLLCKCGHEEDDHYENVCYFVEDDSSECKCKCEGYVPTETTEEELCICGHVKELHNHDTLRGEDGCTACWDNNEVPINKICRKYVRRSDSLVSDNFSEFSEVNKAVLAQLKGTVPKGGTDTLWDGYGGYGGTVGGMVGGTYISKCSHKPFRAFALKTKPGRGGWEVYVGTKAYCTPELEEMDFDIILNCAGSGSVLPNHKIPMPWGKKYEHLNAKEIQLDWPDFGIPIIKLDFWGELLKHIKQHKSKVLIFCMGGHGRTGTALAALMIADGYQPQVAKDWIWKNYCRKAIESTGQEAYLDRIFDYYSRKQKKAKVN